MLQQSATPIITKSQLVGMFRGYYAVSQSGKTCDEHLLVSIVNTLVGCHRKGGAYVKSFMRLLHDSRNNFYDELREVNNFRDVLNLRARDGKNLLHLLAEESPALLHHVIKKFFTLITFISTVALDEVFRESPFTKEFYALMNERDNNNKTFLSVLFKHIESANDKAAVASALLVFVIKNVSSCNPFMAFAVGESTLKQRLQGVGSDAAKAVVTVLQSEACQERAELYAKVQKAIGVLKIILQRNQGISVSDSVTIDPRCSNVFALYCCGMDETHLGWKSAIPFVLAMLTSAGATVGLVAHHHGYLDHSWTLDVLVSLYAITAGLIILSMLVACCTLMQCSLWPQAREYAVASIRDNGGCNGLDKPHIIKAEMVLLGTLTDKNKLDHPDQLEQVSIGKVKRIIPQVLAQLRRIDLNATAQTSLLALVDYLNQSRVLEQYLQAETVVDVVSYQDSPSHVFSSMHYRPINDRSGGDVVIGLDQVEEGGLEAGNRKDSSKSSGSSAF